MNARDPDLQDRVNKLRQATEWRKLRRSFVGPGGLLRFVKHFWHVLEPQTPFRDGWPLHAVCQHLEAVSDGRIKRLLINVPPGFCKALDHDTPILTTWGWKKHGDLVAGDFVFGPDGKPKRVLGCTLDRVEEAFAVKFDDGAEIVASGDHLWEVERDVPSVKPRYRRGRKSMVVTTSDLRISGYKHASNYEKRPDRIRVSEPIELPPKRLMIDPYVLGAWLGDGSSTSGIIYAGEQDAEHFCKLGRVAHVNPPTPPRKSAFYHIVVEGLRVRLRLMGLIGNKHIPEDYLEGSIEQRWELLRGLMDTDGMCATNGSCSFTNKNEAIADGFMVLCRSLGIKAWKTETWSKFNGVTFGPYQFVNFIPPIGATVFKLARKQVRVRGNLNDRSRNRYVDSVTPVGPRRVKCIHVEGNLYLAGKELVTTHNSLLTDVFFPAWEWATVGSHIRYLAFSYSATLTERDNRRFGALVSDHEYQDLFGDRVKLAKLGERIVTNRATGWKLASSVGGVATGERANRVLLDDPHSVKESESDTVRNETIRWFRESMSNRLNNMETDVIIVIMQRVHGEDVSGVILDQGMSYDHLMIPMEYDYDRQTDDDGNPVQTSIGWYDPRFDDGEPDEVNGSLAWPERFPPHVVEKMKIDGGPFMWASQYDQSPSPRGGGIFKREWWQLWESNDGRFPVFDYVMASLDSAFTEQERNDPSALTIWGIFQNQEGMNRAMLVHAWRKHLEFSGPRMPALPGESKGQWIVRTQSKWGLMEWVKHTCERFKVDNLLIEAKASGMSAAQELQNRYGRLDFGVQLCPVKGSKEARAYAAQPSFSQLLVYAPARDWAEDVISEMEAFPKHKYKDLTDSTTQAIKYLRDSGLLNTEEESKANEVDEQNEWLRRHKTGSVADRYFG